PAPAVKPGSGSCTVRKGHWATAAVAPCVRQRPPTSAQQGAGGSVGLLWMTERHLHHPDDPLVLVRAVPHPSRARDLVLPLRKHLVPHTLCGERAGERACAPRVPAPVEGPLPEPATLLVHQVRLSLDGGDPFAMCPG